MLKFKELDIKTGKSGEEVEFEPDEVKKMQEVVIINEPTEIVCTLITFINGKIIVLNESPFSVEDKLNKYKHSWKTK